MKELSNYEVFEECVEEIKVKKILILSSIWGTHMGALHFDEEGLALESYPASFWK